jgi:hypothetical protein
VKSGCNATYASARRMLISSMPGASNSFCTAGDSHADRMSAMSRSPDRSFSADAPDA